MLDLFYIRNPIEREVKRRILLSVAAYAYELCNESIMSDAQFDSECMKVDLTVKTSRPNLDEWFLNNFKPWTGNWIHQHPELDKIKQLYEVYYVKN